MTGLVFVDTNVLVYRHDASDSSRQARSDAWIRLVARNRAGRLSMQVVQELYAVLTRKAKPGVPASKAREIVRDLLSWRPVPVDPALLERAWLVEARYALSWWDALIVAAAQICECSVLLTEDLQHGQVLDTVRVVNPFDSPERSPAQILEALQ